MNNSNNILNTIKLLIYKEDSELLKRIDFDNDEMFLNPLLFAYFNSKKDHLFPKEVLGEILQGYFTKKEKIMIKHSFNKNGVAYVPKVGYFKKDEQNTFTPIEIIKGTSIEILKYSHPLIDVIFKSASKNKMNDKNLTIGEKLIDKNIGYLTNAFQIIKTTSSGHYNFIEQSCKNVVLFKTDPNNTNSFATVNAHGIAFFNVYQEDYNEVFFIDDIAHQTGHIILTTILFDRKKYFIIDENINIGSITKNQKEYRNFYILFHALYTYYTSLLCLNNCLGNNCFDKKQSHEAKGRIGFYLKKLMLDMDRFKKVIDFYNGIEFVLTNDGIEIYHMMKITFTEMITKWHSISKKYDYKNQPYNFTYKEFIKLNSINNA